jgi:ribulose 1,5-bisphosphate synthetase/thiazole synthase
MQLLPRDAYDEQLVAHAHPADWINPTPSGKYHLVVVGGGTAGLVAAHGAAGLGARVALIESKLLGGDCLNFGCVPSKARCVRPARTRHGDGGARLRATTGGWDFPP